MSTQLEMAKQILADSDGDGVEWNEGARVYRLMRDDDYPTEVTDADELRMYWASGAKETAKA